MINGIDTSSVQTLSQNECNAIANSGIQFLIAKCGNGNNGTDPEYNNTIQWAQNAGLKVLAYHFLYPLPPEAGNPSRSPQAQAQAHFTAAKGVRACADLEWPVVADWSKWCCSAAQIKQWALDYLAAYSQLDGRPMIIYTYPNYAETLDLAASPEFANYPLWIASYESTPTIPAPWQSYILWQNGGGSGKLPNGQPVDTDVCPDPSLVWNTSSLPPLTTITPTLQVPITTLPPLQAPPDPTPAPANPIPTPTSDIWTSAGNTISQLFGRTR